MPFGTTGADVAEAVWEHGVAVVRTGRDALMAEVYGDLLGGRRFEG